MTKLTLQAVDDKGLALPDASFDIIFRGNVLGLGYNTGEAHVKGDKDGKAQVDIPVFTDHANITTISGAWISERTVKINQLTDWQFFLKSANPISLLVGDAIISVIPIDITKTLPEGKSGQVVQDTEFDPVRVAVKRTTDLWGKFWNWLKQNLISVVLILVAIAVAIYALKYVTGPIRKAAGYGKKVLAGTTETIKKVVKY